MKRHSRARFLVAMANKENLLADSRLSTDSHCSSNSNTPRQDSKIEYNNMTELYNTNYVTTHPSIIYPKTTIIDHTSVVESYHTITEKTFNDTSNVVMQQPSLSSELVAIALTSRADLIWNNLDMALTDLDHLQNSQVPTIQSLTPQETQSITDEPIFPELMSVYSINPIISSDYQGRHIDEPQSVTTHLCNDDRSQNIEGIQIPDTSNCGMSLNPETGLFEEYLRIEETNDERNELSNKIKSIKNKRRYNQVLRVHGKEYDGVVKVGASKIQTKKPQRQLKPVPCNHGFVGVSDRSFLCGSVDHQKRKDVFDYFWSLSTWEAKKAYVLGLVAVRHVLKRRKTTENDIPTRKNAGIDCYLPREDGIKVKVCRDMFMATLDITKDTFVDWTKSKFCDTGNSTKITSTIAQITAPNVKTLTSESVIQWLDQLAKVPSHYCRSSTSRTYVDEALHSKVQMHKEYVSWCKLKCIGFVQRKRFCDILESKKISIYKPRKDQCDTCVSYKEGNLNEEEYQTHLLKKNETREAKKQAIASLSEEHLVFTMDLQSVQLCPKLLVSSQYYKQKLQLHVFTIYINNTKDVYVFSWHEGDGGVTANEFITCILSFIELYATKGYKKMTIISDGCGYQSRNKVLSSALADVSRLKMVEIQQIFLEKGHTMMEVDSVHSTLEKCCIPPLYAPADYVMSMRKARPNQPYIIKHVDYTFFKNYEAVPSYFQSIRPGRKAGDPTVADIRSLSYRNGETYFKLRHDDTEWFLLPQRRKADLYEEARCLYTAPRAIEKSKFDSLQSLKPFMHRDYHSFYDTLST